MTDKPDNFELEDVGPREPLTEIELNALAEPGGVVGRVPDPGVSQARRDRGKELFQPAPGKLPKWVRDHLDSGGDPEGLLAEVRKRALKAPSRATLVLGLGVVNEIARTEAGAKLVAKSVDRALFDELSRQSGREKK